MSHLGSLAPRKCPIVTWYRNAQISWARTESGPHFLSLCVIWASNRRTSWSPSSFCEKHEANNVGSQRTRRDSGLSGETFSSGGFCLLPVLRWIRHWSIPGPIHTLIDIEGNFAPPNGVQSLYPVMGTVQDVEWDKAQKGAWGAGNPSSGRRWEACLLSIPRPGCPEAPSGQNIWASAASARGSGTFSSRKAAHWTYPVNIIKFDSLRSDQRSVTSNNFASLLRHHLNYIRLVQGTTITQLVTNLVNSPASTLWIVMFYL